MNITANDIWSALRAIREKAPVVHNITNYVVMNSTANALLALGASPVMAHAEEEMEEMVGIASALVINIGTLSPAWVRAMHRAAEAARKRRIPIVLDPVGAGATSYRTRTARELDQGRPPGDHPRKRLGDHGAPGQRTRRPRGWTAAPPRTPPWRSAGPCTPNAAPSSASAARRTTPSAARG